MSKYFFRFLPPAGRYVVGLCQFTNVCLTGECSTGPTSAVRASTNQLFKRFEVIEVFFICNGTKHKLIVYLQVMHPCPHRKFTPQTLPKPKPKKTESECIEVQFNMSKMEAVLN